MMIGSCACRRMRWPAASATDSAASLSAAAISVSPAVSKSVSAFSRAPVKMAREPSRSSAFWTVSAREALMACFCALTNVSRSCA